MSAGEETSRGRQQQIATVRRTLPQHVADRTPQNLADRGRTARRSTVLPARSCLFRRSPQLPLPPPVTTRPTPSSGCELLRNPIISLSSSFRRSLLPPQQYSNTAPSTTLHGRYSRAAGYLSGVICVK
ncbi:hypothetical protein PIB30_060040 [Stylosanthes scabra]|uniref:Uncharacterized protein n=1 Tax=Stylosanthes scabra TaxID=79078 RepID=A0ABU6UJ75_9FABA|nr:hypothetical protein [Stylosanthes scabra]